MIFRSFDDAASYIRDHGIVMVDLKFCDLWGRWHHVTLPAPRFTRALLEKGEYESVEQLKGSMSQASCPDPEAFERSQYMRALVSYVTDL